MISVKRRPGLSEDNGSVPVDFFSKSRFADRLFHYIDACAEQSREILAKLLPLPEIVKSTRRKTMVEAHGDIDIARIRGATRQGPEQRCAHDTDSVQLSCVLAQDGYHFLASHAFILAQR